MATENNPKFEIPAEMREMAEAQPSSRRAWPWRAS